jgi:hypothetical protein
MVVYESAISTLSERFIPLVESEKKLSEQIERPHGSSRLISFISG